MTHCEQIMTAVAYLTLKQELPEFSRNQVRKKIGVDSKTWLNGYTAIFQGMRIDHPGKAPPVGERFQNVFQRVRRGVYVLTDKGRRLAMEFYESTKE